MPEAQGRNIQRLLGALLAAIIVFGVLLGLQLGAAIGELRTRNCLSEVAAKYPAALAENGKGGSIYAPKKATFLFYGAPAENRAALLKRC